MDIAKRHESTSLRALRELLLTQVGDALPGQQAQYGMAPGQRPIHSAEEIASFSPNLGAVLILFYPDEQGMPHLVLIKRASYDGVHSGQVSFPGGRHDEFDDKDLLRTALREAKEEVNVSEHEVELLGPMTDLYIPPSNFLVHPYLGIANKRPDLRPDPREVDHIIEMPLTALDISNIDMRSSIRITEEYSIKGPALNWSGQQVWGATGMMLSELRAMLLAT